VSVVGVPGTYASIQNVVILLPPSFDEAYIRQEQADMRQHREATIRRTEGG
jgi:hypothetical protein